ncbi:MAG: exo-alpha-sialidase [Psychroserpens sp.]|nr:exo-alpha-sialidase [Psychroserpens sp.]
MLKHIILTCVFLVVCENSNAQDRECNFFDLPKPTTIPKDFNPEILDLNGSFKFNVEIKTCDEIYFTMISSSESIFYSEKKNGQWSAPKRASFSDLDYNDADPFLTRDGKRIYFISKRPTSKADKRLEWNIWYADRVKDGWSSPKPLPKPINSDDYDEYFFSISDQGNAFFSSNRPGGQGSFDIYTVKVLGKTTFSEPKNVGRPISSEKYEFDPYISPDERFILFSINENNNSSLHFSYKDENDFWTTPQNLGDRVNITNQDFAPSLSADGQYIFYSNNGQLKWVSIDILDRP